MHHYLKLYLTDLFTLLSLALYIFSLSNTMYDTIDKIDLGFNEDYIDHCDYLDYSEMTPNSDSRDILTALQLNIHGVMSRKDGLKSLFNDIRAINTE